MVSSWWVEFFRHVLNPTWEIFVVGGVKVALEALRLEIYNEHRTMGGKCIAQTLAMEDFMMEEAFGLSWFVGILGASSFLLRGVSTHGLHVKK